MMNPNDPEDVSTTCYICFDELPPDDIFILEVCRCRYCLKCIIAYAEHEINNGKFRIHCPDGACPVKAGLTENEIRSLVSGEILEKYDRFVKDAEVAMDPRRVYCPKPGCGEICAIDPSGPHRMVCPICSTDFCRLCSSIWHEGKTCEQFANITSSFSELGVRRCPECGIPIQKAGGCPSMECTWCGKIFPWHSE